MSATERDRWLLLLSYLAALVYHDRPEAEWEGLREVIVTSTRADPRRREVENMTRTIAEALRDEGRQEGRQEALQEAVLDLLRDKFGKVSRATERVIRGTADEARLRGWLRGTRAASSLADLDITPGNGA